MSLGDLLPVQFYQLAFVCTFFLLPVLAFRADIENYIFGMLVLYMCLRVIMRRKKKTLPNDGKAVFISGCDSGFGNMIAEKLDKEGFVVFAGCLDTESQGVTDLRAKCSEKLHVVELDVTSDKSVSSAGEYIRDNLEDHYLWAVINNAGVYGHGDIELCPVEVFKFVTDVNFLGMVRVTQEFLPLIRKSKGRVVNMSSINGRFPWPSTSAYNSSKYGIECVSDTLRLEMVKFGVKVSIIEPAMFGGSTNIHGSENVSRHYKQIDDIWNQAKPDVKSVYTKQYMRDQIETIVNLRQQLNAKSPEPVIDAVFDAVSSSDPDYRYVLHGGPFPVDPLAVLGTIYPYIPQMVTDWLICRVTKNLNTEYLQYFKNIENNDNHDKSE